MLATIYLRFAFFGLLFTYVAGFPLLHYRSPSSETDTVSLVTRTKGSQPPTIKPAHRTQASKIESQISSKLHPPPNGAVFWSGRKNTPAGPKSVYKDAQKYAKKNKKQTLEQGLKANGIKIPKSNPLSRDLWKTASKTWAERSKGEVTTIRGSSLRPGNIYETVEKPVLTKSKDVTKLTEVVLDGPGKKTVNVVKKT